MIRRWIINLILGSLIAFAVLFVATFSPNIDLLSKLIYVKSNPQQADVIVALSGSIVEDCNHHDGLLDREIHAGKLLNKGLSKSGKVIISGHYTNNKLVPVDVCRDVLARHMNIPSEALIFDNDAYTTHDNAVNIAKIMKQHNWQQAVMVTTFSHAKRAQLALKKEGVRSFPALIADKPERGDKWFDIYRTAYLHRFLYEYVALLSYKWYGYI